MNIPPFKITEKSNNLAVEIGILLGKYTAINSPVPEPKLRKKNLVKSVHSSVSIEGNTLTEEQATAIFEGKRVIGRPNEIVEIQNTIELYKHTGVFTSLSSRDFLKGHKILMKGLIGNPGKWRTSGVGIYQGNKLVHPGPSHKLVPQHMGNLFEFIKKSRTLNSLIKSSVFHYETLFIHPFIDGNGRISRFWQSIILTKAYPVFEYIPIESMVRERQKEYYKVLGICDKAGESTKFIEYMLQVILDQTETFFSKIKSATLTVEERLDLAKSHFEKAAFSRAEYQSLFKTISSATATRDLTFGTKKKLLKKNGKLINTLYHF